MTSETIERVQTKPFERWIGQTVYRSVHPRHGPNAHKTLGYRRGVIIDMLMDNEQIGYSKSLAGGNPMMLHVVEFAVDVNWRTGRITKQPLDKPYDRVAGYYHPRIEKPFEYGINTKQELDWLLEGALLGSNGPVYSEPQPIELQRFFPTYRSIVANPEQDWFPWIESDL